MVTLAAHRPAAQQQQQPQIPLASNQQPQQAQTRQAIDPPTANGLDPGSRVLSQPADPNAKRPPTLVLPQAAQLGAQRSLLTPTLTAVGEPGIATPSHLFSSLVQLSGQEIGFFTGLPSCTPTSADSLVGRNPFFLGVSSSSSTYNPGQSNQIAAHNKTPSITSNQAQQEEANNNQHQQQAHIYPTLDHINQQQAQQVHEKPNGPYPHAKRRPVNGLSMDQIHQTANTMILQPLNFFLSPQQESWLRFGQHQLAAQLGSQYQEQSQHLGQSQIAEPVHGQPAAPMIVGQSSSHHEASSQQQTMAQDLSNALSHQHLGAHQGAGGAMQLPRLHDLGCEVQPMDLGHHHLRQPPVQHHYQAQQQHRNPLYPFESASSQLTIEAAEVSCGPQLVVATKRQSAPDTISADHHAFSDSSQTVSQMPDVSRLTSRANSPASLSCDTANRLVDPKSPMVPVTDGCQLEIATETAKKVATSQATGNKSIEPVKKKSKGGRKKKIVSHEELVARKNRSKERNRVAAKRCRQKRKKFVDELRSRIDNLNEINDKLIRENIMLKSELEQLREDHKNFAS